MAESTTTAITLRRPPHGHESTSVHLLRQYQLYFNENRPHQGIGQRVPTKPILDIDLSKPIEVTSVLGGLHVDYRRAA